MNIKKIYRWPKNIHFVASQLVSFEKESVQDIALIVTEDNEHFMSCLLNNTYYVEPVVKLEKLNDLKIILEAITAENVIETRSSIFIPDWLKLAIGYSLSASGKLSYVSIGLSMFRSDYFKDFDEFWLNSTGEDFKSSILEMEEVRSTLQSRKLRDQESDSSSSQYGGYNGYDDDTIDDAFNGDPDLTWNVD